MVYLKLQLSWFQSMGAWFIISFSFREGQDVRQQEKGNEFENQ